MEGNNQMTTYDFSRLKPITLILVGFLVLVATLGLGYLDHETKSLHDLFTLQNTTA